MGNCWKPILTFVTEIFVLNVTAPIDLSLKCRDKFRQGNNCIPSSIVMFKVSKKTRKISQTCSKFTIMTPEPHLMLLFPTLNIFLTLFYFYYCCIWKINNGWTWETIFSDNKFVFSNFGQHIALLVEKIYGLYIFTLIHPI